MYFLLINLFLQACLSNVDKPMSGSRLRVRKSLIKHTKGQQNNNRVRSKHNKPSILLRNDDPYEGILDVFIPRLIKRDISKKNFDYEIRQLKALNFVIYRNNEKIEQKIAITEYVLSNLPKDAPNSEVTLVKEKLKQSQQLLLHGLNDLVSKLYSCKSFEEAYHFCENLVKQQCSLGDELFNLTYKLAKYDKDLLKNFAKGYI